MILVGEMRDLETIAAALTIAETGHLALATLHTNSAAESINRIIDVFPSNQQSQVRAQLAFVLEGVVTQTLLPEGTRPRPRDGVRDHGGHPRDPRPHPRRQDPPDLLGHAVRQEARHADDERRAVPALHQPRSGPGGVRARVVGAQGVPPDDRSHADGGAGHRSPPTDRSAPLRTAAKRRILSMPMFEYTARSQTGQIQKGQLDVSNKDDVSAYLRKNRLILVSVREAPKQIKLSMGGPRVKTRDIVIFTRQFATMINAGLPLVQSLNILASQTENKTLADVTKAVVYDVESGNTLADAFSKHPKAFSGLYVNMVAAGEAGGILDTILLRLATFLEKNDALVRKVKGAMIYPGVIISVAGHRHRGAARLRDPDVPDHVLVGQPRAAAADPGRDRDVELPDRLLVGHPGRRRRARSSPSRATTPRPPAASRSTR